MNFIFDEIYPSFSLLEQYVYGCEGGLWRLATQSTKKKARSQTARIKKTGVCFFLHMSFNQRYESEWIKYDVDFNPLFIKVASCF